MIHRFSMLDRNIVLDVHSGAVLVVDDLAYRLLGLIEGGEGIGLSPELLHPELSEYDFEQVRETCAEISELIREGYLFSPEDKVEDVHFPPPGEIPVKALCLHVSHDCNLRCEYCFAGKGDFGTGRRLLMDGDTAKRAIDFVVAKSGKRKNIEIDFFGGEPLLAMDTVRETVAYAKNFPEKNFRFTITTNGLALSDEIIDYINKEMSNVVLSLDGRPEVNDRSRKTVNGKGSYAAIVPKFQKLVEKRRETGKDYYVRGTFTADNLDFSEDVLHLFSLGFDQISIEPVVSGPVNTHTGSDNYSFCPDNSLGDSTLEAVYREYEKLASIMADRDDFHFFHFNVDLSQGPCLIKRMKGCGAGTEYVAVTPEGELYPCHQFVGREEYRLGTLADGITAVDTVERFAKMNVLTREACRCCWARYYCSGGCAASNLTVNGSVDDVYEIGCEMERKRLECAIALAAIRHFP